MRRGGGRSWFARLCAIVLVLFLSFGLPTKTAEYAVLAHEAIIDSMSDTNIRPLLLKRFPDATAEEIKEASEIMNHFGGKAARKAFITARMSMTS